MDAENETAGITFCCRLMVQRRQIGWTMLGLIVVFVTLTTLELRRMNLETRCSGALRQTKLVFAVEELKR